MTRHELLPYSGPLDRITIIDRYRQSCACGATLSAPGWRALAGAWRAHLRQGLTLPPRRRWDR